MIHLGRDKELPPKLYELLVAPRLSVWAEDMRAKRSCLPYKGANRFQGTWRQSLVPVAVTDARTVPDLQRGALSQRARGTLH